MSVYPPLNILRRLFLSIILSCTFSFAGEYKLGQGVQISNLPLYVGGYFSFAYGYDVDENLRYAKLDDVSLMLYGEQGRLSYMFELEAEDMYTEVFGDESKDVQNDAFHIERLYAAYGFDEHWTLYLGKKYSPVGFWNLEPINVLRDTTSNPMITEILFPRLTSGAEVHYEQNDDRELSMHFLVQMTKDIDIWLNEHNVYNNMEIDRHIAAGASWYASEVAYSVESGYFRQVHGKEAFYLLGACLYESGTSKFQAELGTQFDKDGATIPYAGYVQYVQRFGSSHAAIVRVESYRDDRNDEKDTFGVLGYTYRYRYPVALKGEYQWHSLHHEERFLFSFSVLF